MEPGEVIELSSVVPNDSELGTGKDEVEVKMTHEQALEELG